MARSTNLTLCSFCGKSHSEVKKLIAEKPADFHVISGDDLTALPTVLEGGSGVILKREEYLKSVTYWKNHASVLEGDPPSFL